MILCCGLLTLDVIQAVEQFPGPNQKTVALSSVIDFGGPAANASAVAAALGSSVRLLTYVSDSVVEQMVQTAGVELVRLGGDFGDSPTIPVSTVLVTQGTGQRAVVSSHSLVLGEPILPDIDLLDGVGCLLVDGHYLGAAIQLAGLAQARGIPVVFDGGGWKPGLEHLLPLVDVAIISADFQDEVPCLFVARTQGAEPIDFQGKMISVPLTEQIVDTLGAGDVLHGAFVHFMAGLRLTEADISEALRRSAQVASFSCQFSGARGWIKPWIAAHSATWD